jgi:hypothetical protein
VCSKKIDIKEFREKGYLQELNRQFLHPLGLALEVIIQGDGSESLGGIWDYRKDSEGIHYDLKNYADRETRDIFSNKAKFIEQEIQNRKDKRINILGFWIEPI